MNPTLKTERIRYGSVSVVVPTLNEAEHLPRLLDLLQLQEGIGEIIIVDAGSRDATPRIAIQKGAHLIPSSEASRGAQLREGIRATSGEAVWMLHADTVPPANGAERILEIFSRDSERVAGSFTVRFSPDGGGAARFATTFYRWIRLLGLTYGDSGIFARVELCRERCPIQPLPLFEDLDFVHRSRRHGKWVWMPETIHPSSRRFINRPFPQVFTEWILLQLQYWGGISPYALAKSYYPPRERQVL